jgi:hypothetical protein
VTATPIAERIESLKAGLLGAAIATFTFSLMTLSDRILLNFSVWHETRQVPVFFSDWLVAPELISGAIAALAGFLFGVTYRYIVRQDDNPHLKSGAVLAFGLVRGLAQVDTVLAHQSDPLPLVILAGESILLFAIAQVGLEVALRQGWVKPFSSQTD